MSEHTEGPWILATSNSWRRFLSARGLSVCEPVTYSERDRHPDLYFRNGGQDGPDARLIAAAPDLYEALFRLVQLLPTADFDDFGLYQAAKDRALAAIAKATP